MIQIYRFYRVCVLLSLFIESSYFSYLISYTNDIIIVQNEWHIFIHPSCTLCCGCVPCDVSYLEFSTSHRYTRKFKKNKVTACLTWNIIMGLQHKCVRLTLDGLPKPWQILKYWSVFWFVCVMFCTTENPLPVGEVYGVCVIPWKQADVVHGFQQWQDRCWQVVTWASSMSTTDDAWHTDMFSCWCCQRARHSLGSAKNCPGPTGLQVVCAHWLPKNPTDDDRAHCMGLYGPFLHPFDMLHWSKRAVLELKHG